MTVCKFGGSSVASADQIKKVKAILEADKNRRVIIVSAPGRRTKDDDKVTDLLYECNKMVRRGSSCKSVFNQIAKRYLEIAEGLGIDQKPVNMLLDDIRYKIDAGKGSDYTASRGEFLSAFIISQYLGWEFIDAKDCIIIKSDGTVNPFTYDRVKALIEDPKKGYVFPGFYGSDDDNVIKTFTRGGSDITGSIVARSINADLYENWTDVSGIYSADPRLIPDAHVIDALDYKEVRELSDYGASVFHEEAIAPIIGAEIPICIKNTDRPEDPGTLIVPVSGERRLAGVSARGGLSCIKLRKLMLFKKHGMRHALLTMLNIFGVRPVYSLYGVDSIVWYFDSKAATPSVLDAMCTRLKKEFELEEVFVEPGKAILGVVGSDILGGDEHIKAAIALREAGITMNFLNHGASEVSFAIGVEDEERVEAVKVVYDAILRRK